MRWKRSSVTRSLHVANGDMITMGLLQGVLNTFVIFLSRLGGFIVDRVILKNQRGHGVGYFITTIVFQILLSILASIITMWFSRRREFRADEGGAQLAGKSKMIRALKRLSQVSEPQISKANSRPSASRVAKPG